MAEADEVGWDVDGALTRLQATMDPYLWQQGKELYSRGAIEDFAVQASGDLQVKVLDPRDNRLFFVAVLREQGRVLARCPCPYRLGSHCRHQVAALLFLKDAMEGKADYGNDDAEESVDSRSGEASVPAAGSVLYGLFQMDDDEVTTTPDGSLVRVVLKALGSSTKAHQVALQLFTGGGWTALGSDDPRRWMRRGRRGIHPRDSRLVSLLETDETLAREVDSDTFAEILSTVADSDALVTRGGEPLVVTRTPCYLAASLVPSDAGGLAVELRVESSGESTPFDEVLLVPGVSPWIQTESGAFHPLVCRVGGAVLEALQEEDFSEIQVDRLDRFLTEGLQSLRKLTGGRVETADGLIRDVEGVRGARVRLEGSVERLGGRLELAYPSGDAGWEWVPAPESPEPWTVERDGKIIRYPPAGQSIARAERELNDLGFTRDGKAWTLAGPAILAKLLEPRAKTFVRFELPAKLRKLDLVERAPRLELDVGGAAAWGAKGAAFGEGEGGEGASAGKGAGAFATDWFGVDFSLTIDGRRLDVDLPELCRAQLESPGGLHQLADGTVLSLAHDSVRALTDLALRSRETLASSRPAEKLQIGLSSLAELSEESPEREVTFRTEVRTLMAGLRGEGDGDAPALTEVFVELLRPYQREAVDWFGRLSRFGLGGILADEMGLGKTLMTLAHLFGRRSPFAGEDGFKTSGSVLVVCPTSLIFNWVEECRRFCPDVDIVGLGGKPQSEREQAVLAGHQVLVTSYALLRRDREVFESRLLRAVVLDEGQHIKNPESQTARAAFALRARERWVLTGTPVENHLLELWSLFNFLLPSFLGTASEFHKAFVEPVRKGEDGVLDRLRTRLRPFLLRRTKEQVLGELPPRIEQIERVPMRREQAALYESTLAEARTELAGADSSRARFRVLAALTRLRQICCHPRLILDEEQQSAHGKPIESAKFELLLELLDECIEEGHRVLLFSQFTSVLDLIEERLEEEGVRRCRLDGSTRDRQAEVSRFREDPAIPVFLISLKAGGYGLNLTEADTVILFDPWWNPAVEEQAAARAHRMGQTLPVHVHKLITVGTVEEKIVELQRHKKELAESVIESDEAAIEALQMDELRALLFD